MNTPQSSTHMGARYRIKIIDVHGHEKASSDWQKNMVLDTAASVMTTGFSSSPVPKLGSSITAVSTSQTGVQAALSQMVLSASNALWAANFVRVSSSEAYVSWGEQFIYTNNGTTAANVSEAGIDNFNRILFTDTLGNAKVWSVSPNESLVLDMDFRIDALGSSGTTSFNVLDPSGNVLKTVNASVTAPNTFLSGTPTWWNLLASTTSNVQAVIDPAFDGVNIPTDTSKLLSVSNAVFSDSGRTLTIGVTFVGATGGSALKGFLIGFNSIAPGYAVVYDTPIHVGSGYTFATTLTINW